MRASSNSAKRYGCLQVALLNLTTCLHHAPCTGDTHAGNGQCHSSVQVFDRVIGEKDAKIQEQAEEIRGLRASKQALQDRLDCNAPRESQEANGGRHSG